MMELILALITLTVMEIVLGLDNIIFISIIVGNLNKDIRDRVRTFGILAALLTRILLLFALTWLMTLNQPFLTLFAKSFSGRDLILIFGGLFLIAKSVHEIHNNIEEVEEKHSNPKASGAFFAIIQIGLLDIIFSLDSVITAVGMTDQLKIMVAAMVIAVFTMLFLAKSIGEFVEKHPTIKILALSFLLLIGFMLIIDGMGKHVSKAYIYFAMGFSILVELLNMKVRAERKPS
jgi:predicted tellurium resistance membrane protein TerC